MCYCTAPVSGCDHRTYGASLENRPIGQVLSEGVNVMHLFSHMRLSTLALAVVAASVVLGASGARSAAGSRFINPVYRHNFADPYILRLGKTYYAYGTGTCSRNLQVMHSVDLVHWSSPSEALQHVPKWSSSGCVAFFQNRMVWAP